MSAFPPISYDARGISYGPIRMTRIQYMARISGISIVIYNCLKGLFCIYNFFSRYQKVFKRRQLHGRVQINTRHTHTHTHSKKEWLTQQQKRTQY
jgi:hypothetical protein